MIKRNSIYIVSGESVIIFTGVSGSPHLFKRKRPPILLSIFLSAHLSATNLQEWRVHGFCVFGFSVQIGFLFR